MTLKLKGSTDGSVALTAPSDTVPTGTDLSFVLPTADGSNGQFLSTDGNGQLSFATVASLTYELGDANLTHQGSVTAGSYTMSGNSRYARIGNVVHLFIDEKVDATISAGSGTMQLTNLPYDRANTNTNYSCQAALYSIGMSQSDSLRGFGFKFDESSTSIVNYFMNSNLADPPTAQPVLATGDRLVGVLTYECSP